MLTAQTQLVAEELSVPLDRVTLIQCDTAVCPDQGTTSGSQSTPTNFNEGNLAQAGATAREALLAAGVGAARRARRSAGGGGRRRQRAGRSRRSACPYGELVAGQQAEPDARSQRQAQTARRVDGARHAGAARRHARRWRPDSSSSCTTCACPACCTARRASAGGRRDARRASTRLGARACPAS